MANPIKPIATTAAKETVGVGTENAAKLAFGIQHYAGGTAVATVGSVIVSQMEYNEKKDDIAELYKKEIAAQLGKSEKDVGADDLEIMAKGNRTIRDDLRRAKQSRNLNIGVMAAATLASVAVALAVIPAIPALASLAAINGFMAWLVPTAVATLGYMAVKSPLGNLGKKIFGMDKPTVGERIAEIKKQHDEGKVVTREQVFSVFMEAQPKLAELVEQQYGVPYEKLKAAEKLQVVEQLGDQLNIAQLTDDINQGRIRAAELAFAVDGQQSGVAPTLGDVPKSRGLVGKIKDKVGKVAEAVTGYHPADDKPEGFSFADRERERRAMPKGNGVTV